MDKRELKNRIQDGFLELAPDVYQQIMDAPIPESVLEKEVELEHGIGKRVQWSNLFVKKMVPAIACLAVVCLCCFGMEWKERNNVYVMLDVNPSVRMELNDSYEIKSIKGLNADGKEFVEELEWTKGQSIEGIVKEVTAHLYEDDYLQEDSSILVKISLSDNEQYSILKSRIREEMQHEIKEQQLFGVEVTFLQGENGEKQSGREVLMAELVKEYGISKEDCENMSVGELLDCYNRYTEHKMEVEQIFVTEGSVEEQDSMIHKPEGKENPEQEDSKVTEEKILEEITEEEEEMEEKASETVGDEKDRKKTDGTSKKSENSTKGKTNGSPNENSTKEKTTKVPNENSTKEKTTNSPNENSTKEKTTKVPNKNSTKEKNTNASNNNAKKEKTTEVENTEE